MKYTGEIIIENIPSFSNNLEFTANDLICQCLAKNGQSIPEEDIERLGLQIIAITRKLIANKLEGKEVKEMKVREREARKAELEERKAQEKAEKEARKAQEKAEKEARIVQEKAERYSRKVQEKAEKEARKAEEKAQKQQNKTTRVAKKKTKENQGKPVETKLPENNESNIQEKMKQNWQKMKLSFEAISIYKRGLFEGKECFIGLARNAHTVHCEDGLAYQWCPRQNKLILKPEIPIEDLFTERAERTWTKIPEEYLNQILI